MAASVLARRLLKSAARRTCWPLVLSSNYSIDEHLYKREYWKWRYRQASLNLSFDWFLESHEILEFLLHSVEHCSRGKQLPVSCLDLGCGMSCVPRTVLAHSRVPVRLVLLDFVHEALQQQKQQMETAAAAAPESSYQLVCADVTCLPFDDGSLDMAMDKGTMDALLKDKARMSTKAADMVSEAERTLTSGGRFVQISDEDPDTRLPFLDYLRHACWDVSVPSLQASSRPACRQASVDGRSNTSQDQPTCDSVSMGPTCRDTSQDQHTCHNSVSMGPTLLDQLNCDSVSTGPTLLHQLNCDSVSRFSAWSFKVIPSRWHREYFIYWEDKL